MMVPILYIFAMGISSLFSSLRTLQWVLYSKVDPKYLLLFRLNSQCVHAKHLSYLLIIPSQCARACSRAVLSRRCSSHWQLSLWPPSMSGAQQPSRASSPSACHREQQSPSFFLFFIFGKGPHGNSPPSSAVLDMDITASEVLAAIEGMQRNKAADIDGIKAEFLKDAAACLVAPLTALFNKVFTEGAPAEWNIGIIHQILEITEALP